LLVTAIGVQAVEGQNVAVDIKEWPVPWERTRPRDPYVAPDGRVWFVGQAGNYIAVLEPVSGKFDRYEIDEGTHPHNLIVDSDGMVWYAGNQNGMIGKLDPATRGITRYPMPDPAVSDPHTLVFDGAGNIWFTAQQSGYVGRLAMKSGKIELIRVETPNSRPYGIVLDRTGRVWFDEFGTNRIGMVNPATLKLREFELPAAGARPRRIAVTSDGMVWYCDYPRGILGRLDPRDGSVREWPNPGGTASLPYAMAVDEHDRIWQFETGTQPNRLIGFDPKQERFFSVTPFGAAQNTVRHAYFDAPTRTVWFGTDANTIGRALLPAATPAPVSVP
jgi:virginiamycin B lyase